MRLRELLGQYSSQWRAQHSAHVQPAVDSLTGLAQLEHARISSISGTGSFSGMIARSYSSIVERLLLTGPVHKHTPHGTFSALSACQAAHVQLSTSSVWMEGADK